MPEPTTAPVAGGGPTSRWVAAHATLAFARAALVAERARWHSRWSPAPTMGAPMIRLLLRAGVRFAFVALMIVFLTIAYATDYAWAAPIFVGTQLVLVALVRYGWSAYDEWAAEYVTWLRAGDVETWAAWHRQYVAWSAAQPAAAQAVAA